MNLSSMTVTQLRETAAELDIAGRSKMKKAELIAAIEFAEAPSADNIPGRVEDRAAAVAQIRANIDAEDEERAAAQRARNRSNYGSAEQADECDTEAGDLLDAALGAYIEPTGSTGQIGITKYSTHEAIATAAFGDGSIGGHVTRERGRWVLRYQEHTIRAKTLGKVAKQWAKRLGFHATAIDIDTMS